MEIFSNDFCVCRSDGKDYCRAASGVRYEIDRKRGAGEHCALRNVVEEKSRVTSVFTKPVRQPYKASIHRRR